MKKSTNVCDVSLVPLRDTPVFEVRCRDLRATREPRGDGERDR